MPAEQDLGLHEVAAPKPAVERSSQPGEESTIRGTQSRSVDLATQDGDFVAENDDLRGQIVTASPAQTHQLEVSGGGDVRIGESRDPVSSSRAIP